MLTPHALADRLRCMHALLARDPILHPVGFRNGVQSVFSWYGPSRRRVARCLRVEPIASDLDWVDFGRYGLAWPVDVGLARLVSTLVELVAESNGHYYFAPPSRIHAGDVVIDVGACEGSFALECIVRHGAAAVWCFEPGARMADALRITTERNRLQDRLCIVQAALGDSSGAVDFLESASDPLVSRVTGAAIVCRAIAAQELAPGARAVASVPQYTLDDWADAERIDRIDFIKVDAEGSDLAVLLGARRSIQRWRPRIAITTYHHPDHCLEMVKYLTSLGVGYEFRVKGVVCYDGRPRPVMLHAACRTAADHD